MAFDRGTGRPAGICSCHCGIWPTNRRGDDLPQDEERREDTRLLPLPIPARRTQPPSTRSEGLALGVEAEAYWEQIFADLEERRRRTKVVISGIQQFKAFLPQFWRVPPLTITAASSARLGQILGIPQPWIYQEQAHESLPWWASETYLPAVWHRFTNWLSDYPDTRPEEEFDIGVPTE